mmetsp:Transcript_13778/g.43369  ORF Transcript_13778/g.43369 Transcript_13778/m.43369 type:complete len:331 (-) Transcript_13778:694-1686(-)
MPLHPLLLAEQRPVPRHLAQSIVRAQLRLRLLEATRLLRLEEHVGVPCADRRAGQLLPPRLERRRVRVAASCRGRGRRRRGRRATRCRGGRRGGASRGGASGGGPRCRCRAVAVTVSLLPSNAGQGRRLLGVRRSRAPLFQPHLVANLLLPSRRNVRSKSTLGILRPRFRRVQVTNVRRRRTPLVRRHLAQVRRTLASVRERATQRRNRHRGVVLKRAGAHVVGRRRGRYCWLGRRWPCLLGARRRRLLLHARLLLRRHLAARRCRASLTASRCRCRHRLVPFRLVLLLLLRRHGRQLACQRRARQDAARPRHARPLARSLPLDILCPCW